MAVGKRILVPVLALILVLGLIDAWAGRRSYPAGDTITYMDMASGITAGNFDYAVNGNFSPLYPAILAVFIKPFQSDSLLEFSAVRVADFLIFLVTLYAFRMFLTRFLDHYYRRLGSAAESIPALRRLPFTIAAYALFAWSCLCLTTVSRVNPDICVAAITFTLANMLLGFKDGLLSNVRFVLFGVVLGVGYFCKAIFFPLSFLFLLAAALEPKVWAVRWRLSLSAAAFLLFASPLVIAMSAKYGHLTFGDAGKIAYLQEVQGFSDTINWQGGPESGTPVHATRKVMENPAVFEFATPFTVSYSPWFDPIYWTAGVTVRYDFSKELLDVAKNVFRFVRIVAWMAIPFVVALLIGFRNLRISLASVPYFRSLWLAGIAVPAAYLAVFIDSRYLAGCLPILAILAIAAVKFRTVHSAQKFGVALPLLFAVAVALQCAPRLTEAAAVIVRTHGDVRDDRWLVAREFERLGIQPGTPVAAIDHSGQDDHWPPALIGDWARLARVRVISEVAPGQFWDVSPDRQAAALKALQKTGAKAVVASSVPEGAETAGWTQIQNSRYYYQLLR